MVLLTPTTHSHPPSTAVARLFLSRRSSSTEQAGVEKEDVQTTQRKLRERGGEIPEKSPGIDGQDDADQSPSFVSRSLDPKPIRVFPSLRQRYFIT
ncbi:hypothetical protein ALC62_06384 [Cyphomyrmex costatus]|uniref:Uncharacterized protein n=1 Tax=Cyphomyrmex costatus TaxID=456900 RepID=A0A195CQ20_9HYME|nr:hypothetical protein ALC62_06384 [Cyphomyrmex costatus]